MSLSVAAVTALICGIFLNLGGEVGTVAEVCDECLYSICCVGGTYLAVGIQAVPYQSSDFLRQCQLVVAKGAISPGSLLRASSSGVCNFLILGH